MNTFIVLVGLMLIVPRTDTSGNIKSLTVLVVDTKHAKPLLGRSWVHHQTKVTNLGGASSVDLAGQWTLKSSTDESIQIDGPERLLMLSKTFNDKLPPLRKHCLDGDLTQCKLGGRPLVQARLTITGGWRLSPLEVDIFLRPQRKIVDDAIWDFLSEEKSMRANMPVQLASALLLEPLNSGSVEIEPPVEVAETFNSQAPWSKEECLEGLGVPEPCRVVEFINGSGPDSTQKEKVRNERARHIKTGKQSQGAKPLEREETPIDSALVDTHHKLLYDLFDPSPTPRYLLYLRKDSSSEVQEALGYGGGGTVGLRWCIPGAISSSVPWRRPGS